MSQVKYKYKDQENFLTAKDYNSFIERVKEDEEDLENENVVIKSKEGNTLDEEEFNNQLKEGGILAVIIEKGEVIKKKEKSEKSIKLNKKKADEVEKTKIKTVNLTYEKQKKTIKLESYTQLINEIKKNFKDLKDNKFEIKEEHSKNLIKNDEDIKSIIQKDEKSSLNFIIEKIKPKENEEIKVIIKFNNEKKNYPLCNFDTLISKIQTDFTDFAISDCELYDSKNNLISEDDYAKLIKEPIKDIKLTIFRKGDNKISLKLIKVFYNLNKKNYTDCKWLDLIKKIESEFKINLQNFYLVNEDKNEVKNERDFEELKSKKPDSNITLYLIEKRERIKDDNNEVNPTPSNDNDFKKIKLKVPQLKSDQITELILNLKTYINELFETKFNELNDKLNSIDERINLIHNEVKELKNSTNQIEMSNISNVQMQNLENNIIAISKYIKGDDEKEIINKIKDLNKKGENPINVETFTNFKCNIQQIMNNSVNLEVKIINQGNFDFPKRLKLKCHKNEDLIVYFNDIIINDGESIKSNENCTVEIPLLYNTSVQDFYPNTIINFYIEKFNEILYEGIAEINITN